jgi:hypothetical protein
MLQYSLKLESGRCVFADRHGFRFEMTWKEVEGTPDFDRMLNDYLVKLRDEGMTGGRRIEAAGCAGLKGEMDDQAITRFGRYAPEESCVVELLFLWAQNRDRDLEKRVLESFHEVPSDAEGCRRWRAFGLDARPPARLKLGACRVEPANVEWRFVDRHDRPVLRCARRGMVEEWMNGPVRTWLERKVRPGERPPARWRNEQRSGHTVDRVEGRTLPRGWFRRAAPVQAEAWICPADGRLYSWIAEDAGDMPDRPLNCCGGDER